MLSAKYNLVNSGSQALPVEPAWRLCLHSRHRNLVEAEPLLGYPRQSLSIEGARLDLNCCIEFNNINCRVISENKYTRMQSPPLGRGLGVG